MDEVLIALEIYIHLGIETEIFLDGYKYSTVKDSDIVIISRRFVYTDQKEFHVVIGQAPIKDIPNFIKLQANLLAQ